MTAHFVALIAQLFITGADSYVKKKTHLFSISGIQKWGGQYAFLRFTGLTLRLTALFYLPVASAAPLFSSAAIGTSTAVAHMHGERFSTREKIAIALILVAVVLRGFV